MNKINMSMLALVAAVCSNAAYALDLGHDVTIKGFGTAGLVYNGNNQADFVQDTNFNPKGVGRTENISAVIDSKVGLQMDWQATQQLSFTGQAVSKQDPTNSWVPGLQWAFAKFKILPNLDIRAGRIRPAIFMLSDYLDINYANPWIRPPVELYSQLPIANMEGVDLLYRPQTGPVNWLIQPFYGNSKRDMTWHNTATTKNILGANISASISDFTLRAGYTYTKLSLTLPNSFETLVRPNLATLCNDLGDPAACTALPAMDPTNKDLSFASVGGTWDNGNYFLMGEWGKRSSSSFVSDSISWYLSAGARLGKFTPYAAYSRVNNTSSLSFNGGTGDYGSMTNDVVTGLLSNNTMDQNTKTLGLRYDFYKNLDLKLQWDLIDTRLNNGQQGPGGGIEGTGQGIFTNFVGGFSNSSHTINLFSVAVDFIF
ncbi:MAG: hypothetical protein D4R63_05860 [Methylococcaceae bacterium]|nr:MAG: hypothetical protein D4R63_05860 [Methylococcaceae bacterium]